MDALAGKLSEQFDVEHVRLEGTTLQQQITLFNRAAIIIAQHGAALNGLMWARPQASVVEILPSAMQQRVHFANMAALLGLRHDFVLQPGEHTPVDIELVVAHARNLVAHTD